MKSNHSWDDDTTILDLPIHPAAAVIHDPAPLRVPRTRTLPYYHESPTVILRLP